MSPHFGCLCFLLISLFFGFCLSAPTRLLQEHSPKQLSLYFVNVPHTTEHHEALRIEFTNRVNQVLGIDSVKFGTLKAFDLTSYSPFTFDGVSDSVSTPGPYNTYATLWKNALLNNVELKAPFVLGSDLTVQIDFDQFESILEVDDGYVEGEDPVVSSSTERQALKNALNSRYEVYQLRLTNTQIDSFASFEQYGRLISGIRSSASGVLGISDDRVILFKIKPGSTIAQFSIHPATQSELNSYSDKWIKGVQNSHSAIVNAFNDFDKNYPPTELTGVTTTTTTKQPDAASTDDEGSAGVVAGAVLGSLALVAAAGGGAYAYKKKTGAATSGVPVRNIRQDFGERSPGADMLSPNGLSNVDIHGEATPNPHNYAH